MKLDGRLQLNLRKKNDMETTISFFLTDFLIQKFDWILIVIFIYRNIRTAVNLHLHGTRKWIYSDYDLFFLFKPHCINVMIKWNVITI